jgi:tetraprenyl-beta-curcumene synthase
MSTATHTREGRIARRSGGETPRPGAPPHPTVARPTVADRLELSGVFAGTVLRYLLSVLPQVGQELTHWRARAAGIPDPQLRRIACEALGKRGNVEGAALFATLAPAAHRHGTVRALAAFQTAYNYLDALSELTSEEDPIANGKQLHQALLLALRPDAEHLDYYEHSPQREDGGYLRAILDACREALAGLPSYPLVAPTALLAAGRIADYQALNLSGPQGGRGGLERWATAATPARSALAWWETAAASGSSLALNALIAAAAVPHVDQRDVREIDRAYFPWIGAVHSLLDSLVDRREDRDSGLPCLLDYYDSTTSAVTALVDLTARARGAAERLPSAHAHRVILTAMGSYYLSAPECRTAEARTIAGALRCVLGFPLSLAILMFRSRRLFHTATRRTFT